MKYILKEIKIKLIFSFLLLSKLNIIISANTDKSKSSGNCTLTRKPSQDPFPSLSKCYKYNNEACCMSVHDDYIDGEINKILSESCIRKYSEFENLMCFGCHPLESNYIDKDNKIIRICKSFAVNLWDGPDSENYEALNKPTTIFDNCGFKVDYGDLENLTNESYIIPSEKFHNFSHFFDHIKIPFYEDYTVEIQDETNENCYNYSLYIKNCLLCFILLLFIFSFI